MRSLEIAASVVLFTALVVPPVVANHVGCGATITTDTILDSDIIDCDQQNAITLGAPDITLDLKGHTVDGDAATMFFPERGIYNPGHANVTITNGTVTNFGLSVSLVGAAESVVSRIQTDGRIHLDASTLSLITKNRLLGVTLQNASNGNTILKNRFIGTGCCAGVLLNGSDFTLVNMNRFVDYNVGVRAGEFNSAHNTTITNNKITNSHTGVIVDDSDDVTVSDNVIAGGTGFGVNVSGSADDAVVEFNKISDKGLQGIHVGDTPGPVGTRLTGNKVSSNGLGSSRAGITVAVEPTGTLIEFNKTGKNGGDGIEVLATDAATTVTGNIANKNGDYGIEATPTITDGGGNKASGNTNAAQCLNIACA